MKELNELIDLLLKNIPNSNNVDYIRNNYNSLKKLQEYIKIDKIVPKISEISENNILK